MPTKAFIYLLSFLLTSVLGLDTKSAATLSKGIIMRASTLPVWYNVGVGVPMFVHGITVGVALSVIFPYWLITVLVIGLFLATSSCEDVVNEVEFHQQQNADSAHENHPPSIESSELSNDLEQLNSCEFNVFHVEVCTSEHEEQVVSVVSTEGNIHGFQGHKMCEPHKADETNENRNLSSETDDGSISRVTQNELIDVHAGKIGAVQDQEVMGKNEGEANTFHGISCTGREVQKTNKNWGKELRDEIPVKNDEPLRRFNLQGPNFLPSIPNQKPEKVILKQHMINERKSAEEWKFDDALSKAVTKLAPERKSKVALMVEAFETAMPIPKCQAHMRNRSAFAHARNLKPMDVSEAKIKGQQLQVPFYDQQREDEGAIRVEHRKNI